MDDPKCERPYHALPQKVILFCCLNRRKRKIPPCLFSWWDCQNSANEKSLYFKLSVPLLSFSGLVVGSPLDHMSWNTILCCFWINSFCWTSMWLSICLRKTWLQKLPPRGRRSFVPELFKLSWILLYLTSCYLIVIQQCWYWGKTVSICNHKCDKTHKISVF